MNKAVTTTNDTPVANPFQRRQLADHVSAGAVAIEQERAIAEAQGKILVAIRFPRDQSKAYEELMEACSRPAMAEEAIYAFPRGGQTVSGPTIRLAEEMARCWRNIDYGLRELSQRNGESEMEAYAWDMERNTISTQKFTVKHIRDKQGGGQALTDQRDIYEIGANMGARRMRARILAIIPGDFVDAAIARCKETLAGNTEVPLSDRIRKMAVQFSKLGIKPAHLEKRMGCKMDDMLAEHLTDLTGIYKSIRDGMSKASDWFGEVKKPASSTAAAVQAAARGETVEEEAGEPAGTDDDELLV